MSDKGIFLDILPRFDMAAAAAIVTKVQSLFKKAGVESSMAFGAGAEAGLKKLQAELIRTENVASNMYIKMRKSAGDLQVAEARINELRAKNVEETSARMIAAQNKVDTARARSNQLIKEQAAVQAAALDAQAAVTAKQAAMADTAVIAGTKMNNLGMIATGSLALVAAKTVGAAGNYEASLARIQVATGETSGQIKELGDGMLQLAPQVGYSAQELQNAAYILAKSGFKEAKDQLVILKAAAQLAKVEGADLNDTMNGLTTTMVDFHVPVAKAADVASQLQFAIGASKVPIDQFMAALHNFEPLMKVIADKGLDASTAISQVGVAMAQMTQNGTGADQASQNLRNTLLHLIDANGPQRNMLGAMGFKPDELSRELSDPNFGMLGVMQKIASGVAAQANDSGLIVMDTMYKNAQATEDLKVKYDALSGASKDYADQLNNGINPGMKDLHAQKELDPLLAQWDQARKKVEGYSDTLNKNKDIVQTVSQVMKSITGTDQGMLVFSQLFGDEAAMKKTMSLYEEAKKARADLNGNVHDFDKVEETYQFKLDATKAAWHSLSVEIGNDFLPAAKKVMDVLGGIAGFLGRHETLLNVVIKAVEVLAARWVLMKAALVLDPVFAAMGVGFGKVLASAESTFGGIWKSADTAYGKATTAAVESAQKSVIAAEGSATRQIAAQDKVAVNAEAAAGKGTVAVVAAAEKQVLSQDGITVAATKTNVAVGSGRAEAAAAGAIGVEAAAAKEVIAEGEVGAAAVAANGKLGGLLAGGKGLLGMAGLMAVPELLPSDGSTGQNAVNMAAGASWLLGPEVGIPATAAAALINTPGGETNRGRNAAQATGGGTASHADGGPIVGPGSKGKDSVLMWGAPGEHVLTADEVDALGGHNAVFALRAAARGQIQGYEDGGAPGGSPGYGNMSTLSQWLSQFQGGRYNNASGDDCSGIASQIINVAMGLPNNASRMTTRNAGAWLAARGFQTGYKGVGAINIGWYNRGPNTQDGHMAVTLPDGVHAEMGGGHGFLLGPGAAGAESGQFDHHMYLPIAGFVGAPTAGGGASGTSGSPYSNGGSMGGSGGSSGSGGSGGSSGSADEGIGMSYDPMSQLSGGFTLQNIAKFATMMLANLALGNPVGRMAAARNSRGAMGNILGGGGGGAVDVDSMITDLPDTADIPFDKAVMRAQTAKANAEKQVGKFGPDSPQGVKALNAYKSALESVQAAQARQEKATDSQTTKAGALSDKLQVLNEKLAEQTSSPKTKQSTIDSTLNQIDQTQEKLGKLPAAAKSAAADTSSYFNDAVNGLVPLTDFIGGGGGLSPVFKRNGGGGGTPDIAPKDTGGTVRDTPPMSRSSLDKLHDSPKVGTLPAVPPGQLNSRSTATVGGGGSFGGYLPVAGKEQDRDPVGAARRGKSGSTVGGGGSFDKTGPVIGDAAYAGMRDSKTPPPDTSGLKNPGIAPPMGSNPATMSAYKQAQANALRGAFAPATPAAPAASGLGNRGGRGGNPLGGGVNFGVGADFGGANVGGGAATRGVGGGMAPAPASYGSGASGPVKDASRQATGGTGGGFGLSGGVLGTVESLASSAIKAGATAAGAEAGGPIAGMAAGAAADIATQELNRAVGFAGQVAGIAVDGLLETFMLNDSPIADPSKSLFGKIAGGLAGAHMTSSNSAGMTAPPLKPDDSKDKQQDNKNPQQGAAPLVHIENMNNHGADGQGVAKDIARQTMAVAPNGF